MGNLFSPAAPAAADPWREISLRLTLGLLANLALALLCPSLSIAAVIGLALAAAGLIRGLSRLKRVRRPALRTVLLAVLGTCLLAVLGLHALAAPLSQWDARSIWFFHARMIWLDDGLRAAHWMDRGLIWSHPDYPKMVPVLGAQVSKALGYWNETAPKGALVFLLAPVVASVLSFARPGVAFPLLVGALFFTTNTALSTGYVDGYLAVYAACAMLHLSLGLQRHPRDLLLGLALGCACVTLKDEGLLFAVCALIAVGMTTAWTLWIRKSAIAPLPVIEEPSRWLLSAAVAAAPGLVWWFKRSHWGLEAEMRLGHADALSRLGARLSDGTSLGRIFAALGNGYTPLWKTAAVLLALVLWLVARRVRFTPLDLLPVVTALGWFAGLILIYLMTPLDLQWHLATSAHRTSTGVLLSALAGAALLVGRCERGADVESPALGVRTDDAAGRS
jgi:hypothetical protein